MEKRLKNYLAATDLLLAELSGADGRGADNRSKSAAGRDALLSEHLVQIRFFQHERLIHLIVTCLFALLTFAVFLAQLFVFNAGLIVLFTALLILLIPYIRHYYILENGVQRMYAQYDRMRELLR